MSNSQSAGWRPSASRDAIVARARLLSDIRNFFAKKDVLEVETPLLSHAANSDPNIRSIATSTELLTERLMFLRTSAEYPMKRLLAAGLPDIYELGRVFRDGESGAYHNPEFTMLEWYRHDMGYLQLAEEVIELVKHCGHGKFNNWSVNRISYRDLFLNSIGLDPWTADEFECRELAQERGIQAGHLDLDGWLDLLLTHLVQPAMDAECLTIIHDFLPQQAALAKIRMGKNPVAERFEIYIGRTELANGYHELTDPAEQKLRFEKEARLRQSNDEVLTPVDQNLLDALQAGMPECSGVALGVDRLLMAILNGAHIDMVLAFPLQKA